MLTWLREVRYPYGVAPRALPNKPSGFPHGEEVQIPSRSIQPNRRDSGEWDPNHRCKAQVLLSFLLMVMVPMCHLELGFFLFLLHFFLSKKSGKGTLCVFFGSLSFFLMCFLGKIILYIKIPSPLKLNSSPLKIGSKIGTPPKGK